MKLKEARGGGAAPCLLECTPLPRQSRLTGEKSKSRGRGRGWGCSRSRNRHSARNRVERGGVPRLRGLGHTSTGAGARGRLPCASVFQVRHETRTASFDGRSLPWRRNSIHKAQATVHRRLRSGEVCCASAAPGSSEPRQDASPGEEGPQTANLFRRRGFPAVS
jgi:hypothetical protein